MNQIKDQLYSFIIRRYQSYESHELGDYMFSNQLFHSFENEFVDFLFESRDKIHPYLSVPANARELIEYCIRSTKEYTYQRNQFIDFIGQYDELLHSEYRALLEQLKDLTGIDMPREELARSFGIMLQRHHERLRLILSSYCVVSTQKDLKNNPLLVSVPCDEYSAHFQLDVLNIDLHSIAEPILDIGCGADGTLVKYLKSQGLNVRGFDRLAPKEESFEQNNWFDFDYGKQKWGMVIAHQSLSTHFIYNYLSNSALLEEYAKLFLKILLSLKADATFCYAPGLPFFENNLEKLGGYHITRKTLASDFLGIGEIAYSTQIQPVLK